MIHIILGRTLAWPQTLTCSQSVGFMLCRIDKFVFPVYRKPSSLALQVLPRMSGWFWNEARMPGGPPRLDAELSHSFLSVGRCYILCGLWLGISQVA
jgi:hypothetical protein